MKMTQLTVVAFLDDRARRAVAPTSARVPGGAVPVAGAIPARDPAPPVMPLV